MTPQARNAVWKPSVSPASGPACAFAARKSFVRVTETVATIATPSAAPIWNDVFDRPEASPASWFGTPASAAIEAVTKANPTPGPKTSRPKNTSPK